MVIHIKNEIFKYSITHYLFECVIKHIQNTQKIGGKKNEKKSYKK
jgi:hypothetical protein